VLHPTFKERLAPGQPGERRGTAAAVLETWDERFGFVEYRSETSHDVKELLDYLKDASHVLEEAVAVLSALRT
jgi:hypothetical protein